MEELASESLRQIATQGILGVLLVVAGVIIYFLYREVKACQDARLIDTRALIKAVEDSSKAIHAITLSLEGNNRTMEARTRATEAVAEELRGFRAQAASDAERAKERFEVLVRSIEKSGGGV